VTETATGKRPWVAAVLSVVFPGLGHVYLREWLRTAMWLALMLAVVSFLLPPELVPQEVTVDSMMAASRNLPTDVTLAILALRALNVVDAYILARRSGQREAIEAGRQCPNCGHDLEDPDLSFCPWCASELDVPTAEDEDSRFGL